MTRQGMQSMGLDQPGGPVDFGVLPWSPGRGSPEPIPPTFFLSEKRGEGGAFLGFLLWGRGGGGGPLSWRPKDGTGSKWNMLVLRI